MDLDNLPNGNIIKSVDGYFNNLKIHKYLGMATPVHFRKPKDFVPGTIYTACSQTVTEAGSIRIIRIETQSKVGPLLAFEDDVFNVLCTFYAEQIMKYPELLGTEKENDVFYSELEICDSLELQEGSRNKVSKAIKALRNHSINVKEFEYKTIGSDKLAGELGEGDMLTFLGKYQRAIRNDKGVLEFKDVKYAKIHPAIAKSIREEFYSEVDRKDFVALKSGPERRTHKYIATKRSCYGDDFVFPAEELRLLLRVTDKSRTREMITKRLTAVQKKLGNFTFSYIKDDVTKELQVSIAFTKTLLDSPKSITFFEKLEFLYGADALKTANFNSLDLENFIRENKKHEKEKISYNKNEISPVLFAIDLTLWQVINCNYKVTGLKGLYKSILKSVLNGDFEVPSGYRYFTDERYIRRCKELESEKAKEKKKRQEEIDKLEADKMEEIFKKFFATFEKDDPKYYKELMTRADKMVAPISEDDPAPEISEAVRKIDVDRIFRNITKEEFLNGIAFSRMSKNNSKTLSLRALNKELESQTSLLLN
jgi:hypothetical protein